MKRISIAAAAMVVLAASGVWAGGAGGVTHGFPYRDTGDGWCSADVAEISVGGFGYGVSRHGERIGGFGLAFFSADPSVEFEGGVGGLINGRQFSIGPLTAAAVAWTGVGCLLTDVPGMAGSWITVFLEADVEIGWALTPRMQVTGYGGMQVLANFGPGDPFDENMLFYTPVAGVRIAWGSF